MKSLWLEGGNFDVSPKLIVTYDPIQIICLATPLLCSSDVTHLSGWFNCRTSLKFLYRLLDVHFTLTLVPFSPTGGRYSVLPGGELHVRHVTSQDAYVTFSCVTQNNVTSEVKRSGPASIHVIGESGPETHTIITCALTPGVWVCPYNHNNCVCMRTFSG